MSKDNMLLGYARGKVGSLVFARRLGQQVTRAYNANPKDAATLSQVTQRVKMANVINMYRATRSLTNHSFEGATGGQTSYNLFVRYNLANNKVSLSKEAASFGACVVAPYVVSKGTLAAIQVQGLGADAVTNIAVGSLVISNETTIAEFASALVANNPGINYGDQLTYLSLVQATDANSGYPVVQSTIHEVTLNQADNMPLRNFLPEVATAVKDGMLAHGALIGRGGFCWILSRKNADGSLSVSSQRIVLTSADVADQYTTSAAVTKAVGSYGYNSDAILVPDGPGQSGSGSGGGGSAPSISSVSIAGSTLVAGSQGTTTLTQGQVAIVINGSALSEGMTVSVKSDSGTYPVTISAASATQLTGTFQVGTTVNTYTLGVIVDGVQLYTWKSGTTSSGGDADIE